MGVLCFTWWSVRGVGDLVTASLICRETRKFSSKWTNFGGLRIDQALDASHTTLYQHLWHVQSLEVHLHRLNLFLCVRLICILTSRDISKTSLNSSMHHQTWDKHWVLWITCFKQVFKSYQNEGLQRNFIHPFENLGLRSNFPYKLDNFDLIAAMGNPRGHRTRHKTSRGFELCCKHCVKLFTMRLVLDAACCFGGTKSNSWLPRLQAE